MYIMCSRVGHFYLPKYDRFTVAFAKKIIGGEKKVQPNSRIGIPCL
jgi:hypothetical protein